MHIFAFSYFVFYIFIAGPVAPRAGVRIASVQNEGRTLGELGKISGAVHSGAAPIGPAQRAGSGLTRMSAASIVKDIAVTAIIRDARMQTVEGHQERFDATDVATLAERMREFVQAIREKIAKLTELFEQIAAGPFSNGTLAKNFGEQAKAINRILDTLWENTMLTSKMSAMGMSPLSPGTKTRGFAVTGQALTTFKEELTQTGGSDGSMLALNGTTEEINSRSDFGLGKISNAEKNMAQLNQNLEVGLFSLARVREEAMKALRSDAPEPERVLFLLQDS